MSSAENGRLCWITEDEIDAALTTAAFSETVPGAPRQPFLRALKRAYDASPADPAGSVADAFEEVAVRDGYHGTRDYVAAVLTALGVPGVPQRPTPRDETSDA